MSTKSTVVTEDHFRYIAERGARALAEDPFLQALLEAALAAGVPPIWIAPEQAAFMQVLLRLRDARDVVEVGTLAGYSAIAMARALPADGRVLTVELDPERADFAERWVARSDVAGRVEVLRGAGADVLARLPDGSADALFLDADKASYPLYLHEGRRLLRPRGLFMADNAFAFGQLLDPEPSDREAPAMKAFNDLMPTVTWLQSLIVPLGDGLWVGVRR
jgi:caffeoyl-CoA O-methyltransferase